MLNRGTHVIISHKKLLGGAVVSSLHALSCSSNMRFFVGSICAEADATCLSPWVSTGGPFIEDARADPVKLIEKSQTCFPDANCGCCGLNKLLSSCCSLRARKCSWYHHEYGLYLTLCVRRRTCQVIWWPPAVIARPGPCAVFKSWLLSTLSQRLEAKTLNACNVFWVHNACSRSHHQQSHILHHFRHRYSRTCLLATGYAVYTSTVLTQLVLGKGLAWEGKQ
jgi:hypothetical protein